MKSITVFNGEEALLTCEISGELIEFDLEECEDFVAEVTRDAIVDPS